MWSASNENHVISTRTNTVTQRNKRKPTDTARANLLAPKRPRVEYSITVATDPIVDKAHRVKTKTARVESTDMGRPQQPGSPAFHKNETRGTDAVTDPVPGAIYHATCPVTYDQLAVIALPRGCFGDPSLSDVGLANCLGTPLEKVPRCYQNCVETGGIAGWAPGYEDGGPLADRRLFPVAYLEATGQKWCGKTAWLPARELRPIDLDNVEPLRGLIANYGELVALRDQRSGPSVTTEAQGCSGRMPDTDASPRQARHGAHSAPSKTVPPIQGAPASTNTSKPSRGTYDPALQPRRIQVKGSWAKDSPSSALSPISRPTDKAQPPTPRDVHTMTAGPLAERRIQHGSDRGSPASVEPYTDILHETPSGGQHPRPRDGRTETEGHGLKVLGGHVAGHMKYKKGNDSLGSMEPASLGAFRETASAVRSSGARDGRTETARRGPETPKQRTAQHSQHEGTSLTASKIPPLEAPRKAAPAALRQSQPPHNNQPFHKSTESSKGPYQQKGATPQAGRPKRTPQYTLPHNGSGAAAPAPRQPAWKTPLATSDNDKRPSKDTRPLGSSKTLGAKQHNLRYEPPKITSSTAGTKHGLTIKTEESSRLPDPAPKRTAPTTSSQSETRPESPNSSARGRGPAGPRYPASDSSLSRRGSGSRGGEPEPRHCQDTPVTWPNSVPVASRARQKAYRDVYLSSKFAGASGQPPVADGAARSPLRPYSTQRVGREPDKGFDMWGGERDPRRD